MKVAVLARGLDRPGGVSRLIEGLLCELPSAAPDWHFHAITDSPLPEHLHAVNLNEVRLPPSHPAMFDHVRAPRAARSLGADVFLATKNTVPLGLGCPTVCIYLDLAYFALPGSYPIADSIYMRAMFRRSARRASRIICISRATSEDVAVFLGAEAYGKTRVVYPGVSESFHVLEAGELAKAAAALPALPERFILYAGNVSPRKNLARLLEAMDMLEDSVGLVITGHRRWGCADFEDLVKRASRRRDVRILDGVEQRLLPALYNLAVASVYPSLYEGFGFPVLESMACGTPVAASRASSIPEAAGEAALLFDPGKVSEVARALQRLLDEEALRDRLRAEGLRWAEKFTWRRSALGVRDVIEEVV